MNTRLAAGFHKRLLSILTIALILFPSISQAQSTSVRSQIAELSQRFNDLENNYNLLKLQVANLSAENNRLKQEIEILKQSEDPAKVEEILNAKIEAHRKSTENYVKNQFERIMDLLPTEKPASIKPETTPPTTTATSTAPSTTADRAQFTFSNDFPKDGEIYVVRSGDTLSKIATQFGSTVRYIQNANKIEDPNSLQIGQKLFIPVKR